MKYGLAVLFAIGAFLPGCSCLRKESKKKEKKTMRAPQPKKRMMMPMNHQKPMPPRMAPAEELALPPFEMPQEAIDIEEMDIMPAGVSSDELPLAQELIGAEMEMPSGESIDIEGMEMPVQTQEEMDIMDM